MTEPLFGWTLGEAVVVIGFLLAMMIGLPAVAFGYHAEDGTARLRWANRVAGVALAVWVISMVEGLVMWNTPLVTK